ncbi:DUF3846 domain-containing protein [Rhodococcus sp. NPDC004095]
MTRIKAVLVRADEASKPQQVEYQAGSLRDIYSLTNCNIVEFVDFGNGASMITDEEGKLNGSELNRRATLLLWLLESRWRNADVIMGDVLIIGAPDEEGNSTSIPEELRALIMDVDSYKVEVQTGGDSWASNNLRYDDLFKAANAGLGLMERWLLVTDLRVVAC